MCVCLCVFRVHKNKAPIISRQRSINHLYETTLKCMMNGAFNTFGNASQKPCGHVRLGDRANQYKIISNATRPTTTVYYRSCWTTSCQMLITTR